MSLRSIPAALGFVALCVGCVESSFYLDVYVSQATASIEGADDAVVSVKTTLEFYSSYDHAAVYYLDSASITVTDRGQTYTIDDPDLDVSKFPFTVEPQTSSQLELELTAPSPVPGYRGLPDYCGATLRSATVTLGFYVPEADTDLDRAPPINTITSFATPILPATALQPVSIFDTTWVRQVNIPALPTIGIGHIAAVGADAVVFAVPTGAFDEYALFSADADSVQSVGLTSGFGQSPAIAGAADGTFFLGGLPSGGSGIPLDYVVVEKRSTAASQLWLKSFTTIAGPPETLKVSAMAPTPSGGVVVGIESNLSIDFTTETVDPQAGKYFGAMWAELDVDGNVLDARQAPGDVLAIEVLPNGEAIVVYGDLPPADVEPREIHVVRQDALGAPLWTVDYAMLSYDATLSVDATGAVFVVANDSSFGGRVVALEISDQGQLTAQFSAAGVGGTGTLVADGRRLVAYAGIVEGQSSVDVASFSAPALLELDAAGNVTKAQTIACSGAGALRRTNAGAVILAHSFDELGSLGQEVLDPTLGRLFVARVD